MGALLQPQSTGIKSGQAPPRAPQLDVRQNGAHVFDAEDDRELLLPWGTDKGQRRPCPLEGLRIKKRAPTQGDGPGRTGVVLDVLEVEAVIAPCCLRDPVRGLVVMVRQLAHSPDIHLLGPLGQAAALEVFEHALTKRGHGSPACTCRGWA
jgi:hypothetical protein